jgi:hypothetical protein
MDISAEARALLLGTSPVFMIALLADRRAGKLLGDDPGQNQEGAIALGSWEGLPKLSEGKAWICS